MLRCIDMLGCMFGCVLGCLSMLGCLDVWSMLAADADANAVKGAFTALDYACQRYIIHAGHLPNTN